MKARICPRRDQRGQAAIMVTLSLVVTLGALGLVVDVGWAYWRHEACKAAAQSAASAAAMMATSDSGFSCGVSVACPTNTACSATPNNPPADALEAGCLYAKQNGFVNSGNQTVVYSAGTTSPPVAGTSPAYWVSYSVSESLPQLFSAVLGHTIGQVGARSTTGVFLQPKGACIYSLDPTGADGVLATGGATVTSSCGIYDDSSDSKALEVKGSGGSGNITASNIEIVGNYNTDGGGTLVSNSGTIDTNSSVTPDPFASLPAPTYSSTRCDSTGISGSANITMPADGLYVICGSISLTGNGTQNFPKGTYIVKDGGITWNNGTVTGDGVTFYLTGSGYTGVSISGNVNVQLSAPTTGTYRGVLFYQDRTLPTSSPASSFTGGSTQVLDGTLYFPTTNLTYTGGSSVTANYTGIVAWTVAFKGSSYFTADTNGIHTGLGLPTMGILE